MKDKSGNTKQVMSAIGSNHHKDSHRKTFWKKNANNVPGRWVLTENKLDTLSQHSCHVNLTSLDHDVFFTRRYDKTTMSIKL